MKTSEARNCRGTADEPKYVDLLHSEVQGARGQLQFVYRINKRAEDMNLALFAD
jgi:hypothetical protein